MLLNLPPLLNDEEDFSYVESLFTNIPIKDTTEYIIEQIYTHKKLKSICSKLIFKRLLPTISFVTRLMVIPWEIRYQ